MPRTRTEEECGTSQQATASDSKFGCINPSQKKRRLDGQFDHACVPLFRATGAPVNCSAKEVGQRFWQSHPPRSSLTRQLSLISLCALACSFETNLMTLSLLAS